MDCNQYKKNPYEKTIGLFEDQKKKVKILPMRKTVDTNIGFRTETEATGLAKTVMRGANQRSAEALARRAAIHGHG